MVIEQGLDGVLVGLDNVLVGLDGVLVGQVALELPEA